MIRTVTVAAGLALAVALGHAQDPERGRLLYENHCQVCHEAGVHFRDGRKCTTAEALTAQIVRWAQELELQWTRDEVADVQVFLEERFYHFDQ
jgi:hypothetical protein